MQIIITIPTKEEIFANGLPITLAAQRERWSNKQLGEYAKHSGVYIHYTGNTILYVGQTSKSAKWGNFDVRLRREFQYSSSQNSDLYQLLSRQATGIMTTMYHFEEVKAMFEGPIKDQLSAERLTLILEQFMIAAYRPVGNKK